MRTRIIRSGGKQVPIAYLNQSILKDRLLTSTTKIKQAGLQPDARIAH